jgi:hypothetical protein
LASPLRSFVRVAFVLVPLLAVGFGAAAQGYPTMAPPPPPAEAVPPPPPGPRGAMVWLPGHWQWARHGYVWVGGHYARPPRHRARWVPEHWEQRPHRWVLVPGHWS